MFELAKTALYAALPMLGKYKGMIDMVLTLVEPALESGIDKMVKGNIVMGYVADAAKDINKIMEAQSIVNIGDVADAAIDVTLLRLTKKINEVVPFEGVTVK